MKTCSFRFLYSTFAVSGLLFSSNFASTTPFSFLSTAAYAQASYNDTQVRQWLENTGNQMVSIVNSPLSRDEQKEKFKTIISRDVDVDAIARFCLGRFWRLATPDQQQHYMTLFHKVLINAIVDRLGEYKGVSFSIGKVSSLTNGKKSVETVLKRPNQPNVTIQWIISTEHGIPKIVDIMGENASLSVTQRGDYTSFITRHGNSIDALLEALEKQILST